MAASAAVALPLRLKTMSPAKLKTLVPPINFHVVQEGIYRSSYPQKANFDHLEALQLKTVITLVDNVCPEFQEFLAKHNINHKNMVMAGTKEGIDSKLMKSIIEVVSEPANHPILIHCNQGKHRTGCVAGTFRKLMGWETSRVVEEYSTIAAPKVRPCDVKYLTELDVSGVQV